MEWLKKSTVQRKAVRIPVEALMEYIKGLIKSEDDEALKHLEVEKVQEWILDDVGSQIDIQQLIDDEKESRKPEEE